jgi:uncharacterized protein
MRVVLDTNVYISALMFGGLPGTLLDLAFVRSFDILISPALLDELCAKLLGKFEVSPDDVALIRARLASVAHLVNPEEDLHVVQDDPDDDRVLECAVGGRADLIVSGDRHLLKLANFHGIPILTVRQFLEAMDWKPSE